MVFFLYNSAQEPELLGCQVGTLVLSESKK